MQTPRSNNVPAVCFDIQSIAEFTITVFDLSFAGVTIIEMFSAASGYDGCRLGKTTKLVFQFVE